ncbi:interferon-inducible double-stranded RNA-dependent protein kinase activator A homolog [Sabethes cyaneus]|uniref:interferon-inducible double-stranded RNA-dependent protein kinase activator A homolog n=1 Tax=Sabethes cyaneus TaxID=53552 RepID=UPI00237EA910|nr:interferon-inducible double-stranded RNA-dependent protein kinase activator A homolog [Sabethes cyaneus]
MDVPPPKDLNELVADYLIRSKKESDDKQVALKMKLTSANDVKTPVSLLQERLSRRGIAPQYDLLQVEGPKHEPTFRYRVSCQDKDAMGTGKSKKEAQHAAAEALIDKLEGISLSDPPSGTSKVKPNKVDEGEDEPTGNYIGQLQEMCVARRWPPPTYETEKAVGLPHLRQFTIGCSVLKYHEVGKGKSKKLAKHRAAKRMWQRLQEQPLGSNQIVQKLDEESEEELEATTSTGHGQKDSQFHSSLKARTGKTLSKLQATCLIDQNVDFVQMLHEIATEQRFEVTFVDIDEKTSGGHFQCLVQLSTLPVAVCHGSGTSAENAQAAAARNSLEYLKVITKP